MAKQRQRIVNANTQVGRRGATEDRGPVEFSDRYKGPQTRLRTEQDRAKAPQSERSQAPKGAAVTRSKEHKEALTAPKLATERTTLPQAQKAATDERRAQPEQQAQRAVAPAERPRLQETFPRSVADPGTAKMETAEERIARKNKAIADAPKVPFSDRVGLNPVNDPLDARRRASR